MAVTKKEKKNTTAEQNNIQEITEFNIVEQEDELKWQDFEALDKLVNKQSSKFTGDYKKPNTVSFIPTVSPTFNKELGGVPLGRYISVVGKEQSFKSTMFLMLARSVIDAGYGVLYIDSEMTMDKDYIIANGITEDQYNTQFRLVHANIMEEMLWITRECVENFPNIKLIVVDSLPSLDTIKERVETKQDIEKKNIAGSAYYLSRYLPRLKGYFVKNQVCFAYSRQYRSNIGNSYGSPVKESGGLALDYFSDIKLATSCPSTNKILDSGKCVGYNVAIKTNKSKVGGVFAEFNIPMLFPEIKHINGRRTIVNKCGIDEDKEWQEILKETDIIKRSGAYYKFVSKDGTEQSIQGTEKLTNFLRENKEEFEYLKSLCKF
jgi:RecA/RadA recombinase